MKMKLHATIFLNIFSFPVVAESLSLSHQSMRQKST